MAAIWLGLSLFRQRRAHPALRRMAQLALAHALTLLLFLPWLSVSLRQISSQPNLSQSLAIDQLLRLLFGTLAYGITFEHTLGNLGVVIALLMLFGLLPARQHSNWRLLLPVAWASFPSPFTPSSV